jgi:hypothetical protein
MRMKSCCCRKTALIKRVLNLLRIYIYFSLFYLTCRVKLVVCCAEPLVAVTAMV